MKIDYNQIADGIINKAKQVLAAGQPATPEIDTTGMSQMGKHVFGKVNDFSVSAKTEAFFTFKDGYSHLTSLYQTVKFGGDEFKQISAAQDKLEQEAAKLGFEL